jgi:hypothetical protein
VRDGAVPPWAAAAARKTLLRSSRMAGNDASRSASGALGTDDLQPALLRDIFGPTPFRPVAFDPALRTPLVVSLAEAAYAERMLPSGELDPHRLAVLADALEEVGADAGLLAHLRSPGPHVRGCFAVDLALARG